MPDLTQNKWLEQLTQDDNALILDVRTKLEIEEGMIPKALLIDIQNAPEKNTIYRHFRTWFYVTIMQ